MDVLEHLMQEHRKAEQLLSQLASSQPGPKRRSMFAELCDALDLHMEVEEREVYPLVQATLGAQKADEAESEHNAARSTVAQATESIENDAFLSSVETLTQQLNHHVEEEENEIFPALRRDVSDEIAALGDAEQVEDDVEAELKEEGATPRP
jgi:hemerythrin-like domain-containing protein